MSVNVKNLSSSNTSNNNITIGNNSHYYLTTVDANKSILDFQHFTFKNFDLDRDAQDMYTGECHSITIKQDASVHYPKNDLSIYVNEEGYISSIFYKKEKIEVIDHLVDELTFIMPADCTIQLPDGGYIKTDSDGNIFSIDGNRNIIYKNYFKRSINNYIKASDILSEFINDIPESLTIEEVYNTPIKKFIDWMIEKVESIENDQDEQFTL